MENVAYSLEDFNDGHSPGSSCTSTKLAVYKNKYSESFLSIFENVLPVHWSSAAYDYAVKKEKPWGVYITTADALNVAIKPEDLWSQGDFERAISLVTVRAMIFGRGLSAIGKVVSAIHGTAVWCLSSAESNSVSYHIDYAELYRYETNVIHPPLYAGTCHLSPVNTFPDEATMVGGDFWANCGGLEHYKRFGYKGRLATTEELDADLQCSSDWIAVKYRHNRGILHDGNYPHLSTPVQSISAGTKRVILGLNCFSEELGESCTRAPEHSDAFNRTVKLYQSLAAAGLPVTQTPLDTESKYGSGSAVSSSSEKVDTVGVSNSDKKGVTAKDLLGNPALARLLVTAARKVKALKSKIDSCD